MCARGAPFSWAGQISFEGLDLSGGTCISRNGRWEEWWRQAGKRSLCLEISVRMQQPLAPSWTPLLLFGSLLLPSFWSLYLPFPPAEASIPSPFPSQSPSYPLCTPPPFSPVLTHFFTLPLFHSPALCFVNSPLCSALPREDSMWA